MANKRSRQRRSVPALSAEDRFVALVQRVGEVMATTGLVSVHSPKFGRFEADPRIMKENMEARQAVESRPRIPVVEPDEEMRRIIAEQVADPLTDAATHGATGFPGFRIYEDRSPPALDPVEVIDDE